VPRASALAKHADMSEQGTFNLTADSSKLGRPRVVFLHGLESKATTAYDTAFGAPVHGPCLHIGRIAPLKRASILRSFFELPHVIGAGLVSACSCLAVATRRLPRGHGALGAVAPLVSVAANYEGLKGDAVERSLEKCVAIASRALHDEQPSVLAGMSWGGAVVHLMVHRGLFAGPIVLLAPAAGQLASHLRRDSAMRRVLQTPLPSGTRGVVVHGDNDTIVPLSDSTHLLTQAPLMVLRVVPGDDHSLAIARPLIREILTNHPEQW